MHSNYSNYRLMTKSEDKLLELQGETLSIHLIISD